MEELRAYYSGQVDKVKHYESKLEEEGLHIYYEWIHCYAFKNPDAQKDEKLIDSKEAIKRINSCFKPMRLENDIQSITMQRAHEEVLREIISGMENEHGKVKINKGGRFKRIDKQSTTDSKQKLDEEETKEEIDITPNWFDHGPEPKDLITLVLNIFLYRINVGLSLESLTVMSINGDYIYIVVKADEQDLRRIAEESNYTMQLAIGLTDLTSLEP
jgi:hypothetical protein